MFDARRIQRFCGLVAIYVIFLWIIERWGFAIHVERV